MGPHPSRKSLESYPLAQQAKFGVEIEFKAFDAPLEGLPPQGEDFESSDQVPDELWQYDSEDQWENPEYVTIRDRIVAGYWIGRTVNLIKKSGFRAFAEKHNGNTTWAVGPMGMILTMLLR